mmetsp:Transcript_86720/g.269601  ORF Transcript_86720/g.269601 Transcript_86720/m.269601 type:complete len:528 (+) Transcript_86720:53-1636(+)
MPGCELPGAVEVIADRLLWASVDEVPEDNRRCHYFSIDEDLVYQPFCSDFGPLNLGMVYQYCKHVAAKLDDLEHKGRRIVHVCSLDPSKRANAAFLMCAYQVIMMRRSAQVAFEPFSDVQPSFLGFRDALPRVCNFRLTIMDCLEGLEKAIELGWFNWRTFDLDAYEFLDKVENCDANWIVPKKFLAFAGPSSSSHDNDGFPNVTPEDCLPIFEQENVGLVVRLNRKDYDRSRFVDKGVRHVDLYFADGSCPPEEIISRFLTITEQESGAIAVHCKAGLGRTCTLIGLYVMKHYRFPSRAFIGWARICRPGSVLGPQQQFLVDMQDRMFAASAEFFSTPPAPALASLAPPRLSGAESKEDVGQGEWLCGAKRGGRSPHGDLLPQPIPFHLPPSGTPQGKAPTPPQHVPSHAPMPPSPQSHGPPPQRAVPLVPMSKAPSSQPVRTLQSHLHAQATSNPGSRPAMLNAAVKVPALPPQQMQQPKVLLRHCVSALPTDMHRQRAAAHAGPVITRQVRPALLPRTSPVSAF